jgi:uncharacterized membrane protein
MVEQCTGMMRQMGNMMGDIGGMMSGGMMDGNMMGSMMWSTIFGTIIGVTLLSVGIALLVRLLWTRVDSRKPDALSILQERFARGDIGLEEYQERRSVLQNQV